MRRTDAYRKGSPAPVLPSAQHGANEGGKRIKRKAQRDLGSLPNAERHLPANKSGALERSLISVRIQSKRHEPVTAWNFDWDDNIFFMPTQIRVYHKQTGEERGISTRDFALVREQVGKSGEYADYEMRPESLRFFGDGADGTNHFLEDVKRAVASGRFKGPSFAAFVRAMRDPETAKRTTLITARLHSPEAMHAGLKWLQAQGFIAHVPPLENLIPVNYPPLQKELGGSAVSPSAAKAVAMIRLLDKLNRETPDPNEPTVLDAAGTGRRRLRLWGFSDDDLGNYKAAVAALSAEMKKGRWPNVKITIFYTGTNTPDEPPRVEVLTPDGGTRPARRQDRRGLRVYPQAR